MPAAIHHEILLSGSPQQVYEALTDPERFAAFTGAAAEIDPVPGGAFACFGGLITGRTIEAIPGSRLVQAWRVFNWDEGVFSIARFELVATDEGKTRLVFDHTGFPEEHRGHLDPGWHHKYWDPLKKYLGA
ncbi:MAG: SRPBCC domain-containing protein [Gammaproteobacteria bacterium]|nr:SRPBCC domain-containing protein [Gammaproteobacteria bacterium]